MVKVRVRVRIRVMVKVRIRVMVKVRVRVMVMVNPRYPTIVKNAKIMIVGEAPGKEEEAQQRCFVGASGQELRKMLNEAGISDLQCSFTNVFFERPQGNAIENFCVKKSECGYSHLPPLSMGKYIRKDLLHARESLHFEINASAPNLVLALGNTACWALLDKTGISTLRGALSASPHCTAKILPAYHPAAILRNWELRHVTIMDLFKAEREQHTKEIIYDEISVCIEPTLLELAAFYERAKSASLLAYDIETKPSRKQILCISFAIGRESIVVPFVDRRKAGFSYWNLADELAAWDFIRAMLQLPMPKVTQNGLYDISWLWKIMGLSVAGRSEDTMLFHHSMYPEMSKGLDFLGSVYCNVPAWKTLHKRGDFNKKED